MLFSICIFRPSPSYTISSISNRILCRLVASCVQMCPVCLQLFGRLPESQGVRLREEVGHQLVVVGHWLSIQASQTTHGQYEKC